MQIKPIIILLILSCSFSAIADEKRGLVLKMLEVTEAKKNHDIVIQTYIERFSENPVMNTDIFRTYFKEAMAWDGLIEPMISIYVESYTEEELRAITKFFGSPIGKSFISKSPEVNQKSTALMMARIQKAMSHLQPK